jgi:hypothetical protein
MRNQKASPNGALTRLKKDKPAMDEHLFLKGQRVITPEGEGEVVDAIGDHIEVKLDNGETRSFPSSDLTDDNDAG